jgi:hypothetical protein
MFACDQCTLLMGYAILIEVYYLVFGILKVQCGNCKNIAIANQFLDIVASSMCKITCGSAGTDIKFYLLGIYNIFKVLTRGGVCGMLRGFNVETFIETIFEESGSQTDLDDVLNPNILGISLDSFLPLDFSVSPATPPDLPPIDSIDAMFDGVFVLNPANTTLPSDCPAPAITPP